MTFDEASTLPLILGWIGFGGTAIAYSALGTLVLSAHPGTRQADWLVAALFASGVWGGVTLAGIWAGPPVSGWLPWYQRKLPRP